MAALAIVSMLLTAAFAVVGSMSRAEVRDQARHEDSISTAALSEAMRADLLHTYDFIQTDTGYVLKTRLSLDARTMERQHITAEVEYLVRKIGVRPWLMRIQRQLPDGLETRDLVCSGVSAIRIERAEMPESAPAQGVAPVMICDVEFDSPGRAPARVTVRQD
jgi:hypothetical protein